LQVVVLEVDIKQVVVVLVDLEQEMDFQYLLLPEFIQLL
jgi:hypothetical protein